MINQPIKQVQRRTWPPYSHPRFTIKVNNGVNKSKKLISSIEFENLYIN